MTTSDWITIIGIMTALTATTIGGIFMVMSKIDGRLNEIVTRLTNIEITVTYR